MIYLIPVPAIPIKTINAIIHIIVMMIFETAALEIIRLINETNNNVLAIGSAGVGKSTLINYILATTTKKALVVAPTGIAAINVGGCTMHSMFGIPIGMYLHTPTTSDAPFSVFTRTDLMQKALRVSRAKKSAIRKATLIIIDEVSMLRADLLDAVDQMLRIIRNTKRPFGGMQMMFVGDMLQLPPVICDEEKFLFYSQYDSEFFFDAKCMDGAKVNKIELTKIHRQTDSGFIGILNALRSMKLQEQDIDALNERVKPGMSESDGIYITTHNYKADIINSRMTAGIKEQEHMHFAEVDGYFNVNSVLAQEGLTLKKGMKVMTLINNADGSYFNGKIGRVINEPEEKVEVRFDDGLETFIMKHTWENITMEYDSARNEMRRIVSGRFTQYPLKPAYAITVHKSQGLSFDKAILDINEVFAAGQAYTAVSRLRSLGGLTLVSEISPDVQIRVSPRLAEFMSR